MSCSCENKNACTCSSTLGADVKYDGLPFVCTDPLLVELFSFKAGDNSNQIFTILATQICALLNSGGNPGPAGPDG